MQPRKLLLVGWDGADWHLARPLLAQGRLPMLAALVAGGASGPLESLQPYLSPMLWNTIATGKHPAEHGIIGFTEWNAATGSLQPMSSHTRRVKALWNMLSQEGFRSHVLGWFASHPAEQILGTCVAETFAKFPKARRNDDGTWAPPDPVRAGSVFPDSAAARLAPLRMRPEDLDAGLLEFFIPQVRSIDLRRDPRPDNLLGRLAELYTLHNAAIATLDDDPGFSFLAVYYHFLDWICHDFMEYAAPQRPGVSERDFALYGGVVDKAYELQDLLLRDLLHHAGPNATCLLCSDHGFLSGDERPARTPDVTAGIAAWHRPQGILALAGPGIRRGFQVDGARLFDIAPTVLAAFALPIGEDMRGRVLEDVFTQPPPRRTIPSWEDRGPALAQSRGGELSPQQASELLRQFEDLGYVSLRSDPFETAESATQRENAWNLGQALLNDHRTEEALPHLEYAFFHNPDPPHVAAPLARCQALLGLREEALETAETIADHAPDNAEAALLLADIARLAGNHELALRHLEAADRPGAPARRLALTRGLILLHLGRFADARALFEEWFRQDANDTHARLGLTRALIGGGLTLEAETLAHELVRATPGSPTAWFSLGQVRAAAKDHTGAAEAYSKALRLDPTYLNAEIGLTRQERKALEATGRAPPFVASGFDFTPDPDRNEHLRREAEDRLARLRAASQARLATWRAERDRTQRARGPQTLLRTKPVTQVSAEQPPIIIVSGLPRSGTSLLMQLLERGGVPLKTDGKRAADTHNERGYYEWESIKTLHENPDVIDQAAGRAVKVVSLQLQHLPRGRRYDIVWMDRPVEEVARSQERMLRAAQPERELPPFAERQRTLAQHRTLVLEQFRQLAAAGHVRLLELGYHDTLRNAEATARSLHAFLGDRLPNPEALPAAVEARLWHERS